MGEVPDVTDVSELLRQALRHGDEQDVRFPLADNVPNSLLSQLAEETYRYAVSRAEQRGEEDTGWATYPDGILSWWANEAALNAEEARRLHKFRSDVVRHLEELGLAWREHPRSTLLRVRKPDSQAEAVRNPGWVRDEVVLALDLFVRESSGGRPLPGKSDPQVLALSQTMAELPIHPRNERGADFRNPTGVALKLANFRAIEREIAIERGHPGAENLPKGMGSYSALDQGVFEEFYDSWDLLHDEATAIIAEGTAAPENDPGRAPLITRPVEEGRTETFDAVGTGGGLRTRRESQLVQSYKTWMSGRGWTIVRHEYRVTGEARPLRCDAYVESLDLLIEAKAHDNRESVRLAVGQLMDYRRLEVTSAPRLAVLLPHEPADDHKALLRSVNIDWIWQDRRGGFIDSVGGQLSGGQA